MNGEQVVTVTLIVKGGNSNEALNEAGARLGMRLNEWFNEDAGRSAPFPEGSLLYWTLSVRDASKLVSSERGKYVRENRVSS